jgi:predicted metal-dependent hydrolase
MILALHDGMDQPAREAIVAQWYREQIKSLLPELISKWELILGVKVE